MEIRKIEDIEQAHKFVQTHALPSGAFLQSQFWGEFQNKYNLPYWYFGAFEESELISVALVFKLSLPTGKSYLYCPKGPVVKGKTSIPKELMNKIENLALEEGAIFLRFEPSMTNEHLQKIEASTSKEVQPKSTWILDISKPEEEILSGMKQKTRYNIRLAGKKKIIIRTSNNSKDVEFFFNLAQETAKRNGINTHSKNYYTKMIETLSEYDAIKLYLAEYEGKTIAANLMLYFGGAVTYLHGGSNFDYRNLMAPYLLHWQAIQDAKREGCNTYDFGGVSPENNNNHKWSGISRFKRGFGGKQIDSVGTFDLVYNKFWYKIYTLVRKFR